MSEWYIKELRRIEIQKKELNDRHNTLEKPIDLTKTENVTKFSLEYAPRSHETWEQYAKNLEIHVEYARNKNWKCHIDTPKGAWYTHRSPAGCFMCENINMIHFMLLVIKCMAKQYPNTLF